jgi:autotransporter-associated beta strand protein
LWSTPANWDGTAPVAGDFLVFTNTIRLINTNNFVAGTLFGGITFETPSGAFNLWGNQVRIGGMIVDKQEVTPQTIHLPLFMDINDSGLHVVDVIGNGSLTFNGVVSGVGIGKLGGGLLTLNAANTFNGFLKINQGTVSVTSDANLGAVPSGSPGAAKQLVIAGGTLRAASSFTINANRGIGLGIEGTFEVGSGITLGYNGIIADDGVPPGGLTKLKFGGLTLSGANTWSGPTAVKNGTLTLDFTQAGSPANNVINPVSPLTLGGATAGSGTTNFAALIMNGKASTANSQTFNGTTIALGPAQIRANSGAGGSANIALGLLTHNIGGVVNVIPPTLIGGTGNITTTAAIENGIIGGWATVSDGTVALQGGTTGNAIPPAIATNLATVDASGNIVPYTAYTPYVSGNLADILWGTNNVRITGDAAGDVLVNADGAGTTHDVNTLTFSRGVNWGLKIGAGNTLRLGKTGALFSQHTSSSPTWGVTSSAAAAGGAGNQDVGTLTAGGAPDTPGEIIVNLSQAGSSSANNMVIDSKVTDNGTGPVTLVKTGPGFMKLRGHNTYSGGTFLHQGRIQLSGSEVGTSNPDGLGTGPLYIFPSGYLFMAGTGSPITNDMFIAGDAARQEQGIGAIRTSGGWVIAGTVTLIGDATIGGNGGLSGPIAGKITGPFSLSLCSAGTVNGSISISNPSNDWTGTTIIQARNNTGANTFNSGTNECIPHGFGKGNVIMQGYSTGTIVWNLNGFSETINGLSTAGTGASCTIQNAVTSTTSTLTVGENDQSGTFGGTIRDNPGIMALTKVGGGKETLTAANTYSGITTINDGTLALSGGGSISNSSQIVINGGTLDVNDVAGGFAHAFPISMTQGALALRNTVSPGIGSLTMSDSRLRVTSVGSAPIVVETALLTTGGAGNYIDIVSVGNVPAYPAQFTIVKYTGFIDGAGFNFQLGSVPTPTTVGYISNNVDNSSVDLVLLDGPKSLLWTGVVNNDWDINTTLNWRAFGVTPSVYLDVDLVRFDDDAVSKTVNLTTILQPSATVVSNSATYTFTGPGKLSGPTGLTKEGAGTLILDNTGTNDFFGPLNINGGTLQVGNNSAGGSLGLGVVVNSATLAFARSDAVTISTPISGAGTVVQNGPGTVTLSGNSTFTGPTVVAQATLKAGSGTAFGTADNNTTVNPGATLDVNGQSLGAEPVVASGDGVEGNGAIINTGSDQINALRTVTLAGDVTFGGTSRWDIRNTGAGTSLSTMGNPYKITKVGSNQVSLVSATNIDGALGDIEIREGTFSLQLTTAQVGNPNSTLTVHGGATLGLFGLNANPLQKLITLQEGARVWSENGSNIISTVGAGQINLEGTAIFDVAAAGTAPQLTVNAELVGAGGMVKIGAGRMVIAGAFNGYQGQTIVSNGTLLVDGNYTEFGNFSVRGGTLGGVGNIAGPVVVEANGSLAPGSVASPLGTLSFANSVALGGTNIMDVDKTGGAITSDFMARIDALTLGGTLRLNLTGEALADGDSIPLYGFNSASGSFSSIIPATPGPNLKWDTSALTSSGALLVAGSRPEFSTVSRSDGNIVMGGSGGSSGAAFRILMSPDIAAPLSSWTQVASGTFDASGNFNVTVPIDDAPQRFFLIQLP